MAVGSALTIIGAAIFMILQTSFARKRWSPDLYKKCRRQLFDTTSVTNEQNKKCHRYLTEVVEKNWDGDLSEEPWLYLLEGHPSGQKSLLAVYDRDSRGPFGDSMETRRRGEEPDSLSMTDINESEKWDWVCAKGVLDDWFEKEIANRETPIKYARYIGFSIFLIGVLLHLPPLYHYIA